MNKPTHRRSNSKKNTKKSASVKTIPTAGAEVIPTHEIVLRVPEKAFTILAGRAASGGYDNPEHWILATMSSLCAQCSGIDRDESQYARMFGLAVEADGDTKYVQPSAPPTRVATEKKHVITMEFGEAAFRCLQLQAAVDGYDTVEGAARHSIADGALSLTETLAQGTKEGRELFGLSDRN